MSDINTIFQQRFKQEYFKVLLKKDLKAALKYMHYLEKLHPHFVSLIKLLEEDYKAPSLAKNIRINMKNDFYNFSCYELTKYKFSSNDTVKKIIPYINYCWDSISTYINDDFFDTRYKQSIARCI